MPNFLFNLISVPKLTQIMECHLIFDHFTYVIHKSHSNKMISITNLRGGLYNLNQPQVAIPLKPLISNNTLVNLFLSQHTISNNFVNKNTTLHDTN